jgi:cysteine synthase A
MTQKKEAGRGRVYDTIADTVGNTPMVRLGKLAKQAGCVANIYAKLEFFNPLSSVKDRIALSMVEAAENSGLLKADSVLVEPTSGNTGIALAFVCAAKGYKLILTMPESMSIERRKMLQLLGAEVELTPAAKGMRGAIDRAQELVDSAPNIFMLQQFENAANPKAHRDSTALEIWNDLNGKVDAFIAGVGTGGTITGTGEVLKERNPEIRLIAVEPEDSPILSGGQPGPHKIQGIGAGFIPEVMNTELVDEVVTIGNETAFATAREIARTDGIPVGISSGATLAAALEVGARPEMKDKNIVVICASTAERYLTTDLFASV